MEKKIKAVMKLGKSNNQIYEDYKLLFLIISLIASIFSFYYLFCYYLECALKEELFFDIRLLNFIVVFVTFFMCFIQFNKEVQLVVSISLLFTIALATLLGRFAFKTKESILNVSQTETLAVIYEISRSKGGNGFDYWYKYTSSEGILHKNVFKLEYGFSSCPSVKDTVLISYSLIYPHISLVKKVHPSTEIKQKLKIKSHY